MATRWGICSAGKITHDFLLALQTLSSADHKTVAIASRDLKRSQEYAKRFGICKAYGSYEELAKDPDVRRKELQNELTQRCLQFGSFTSGLDMEEEDVIYVGSIHPQHLPLTLLFLRAKKNILCEKPMGMNTSEVREMIRVARENNVFLMEGFWTRFFPASEQIRTALCQKSLGDAKVLYAQMCIQMEDIPRLVDKKLGGGVILDIGGYCIQFASMVFGPEMPESIIASGRLHETGVDETVAIILNYSGNRQAVINTSIAVDMPGVALIGGTKGNIQIPDHMNSPTVLLLNGKQLEWPLPPTPGPLYFEHDIGLRYEAEHVRQCLLKDLKESPIMPLQESETIAVIMDEARRQVGVLDDM